MKRRFTRLTTFSAMSPRDRSYDAIEKLPSYFFSIFLDMKSYLHNHILLECGNLKVKKIKSKKNICAVALVLIFAC